jgi:hypothetical protein
MCDFHPLICSLDLRIAKLSFISLSSDGCPISCKLNRGVNIGNPTTHVEHTPASCRFSSQVSWVHLFTHVFQDLALTTQLWGPGLCHSFLIGHLYCNQECTPKRHVVCWNWTTIEGSLIQHKIMIPPSNCVTCHAHSRRDSLLFRVVTSFWHM